MPRLRTIAAALALVAGCASLAPAQQLDARVRYSLKKVTASLEKAEKYIRMEAAREAAVQLEAAEREITQIRKDFQFDESHPEFVAVVKRMEKVAVSLRGAGSGKAETETKTEPDAAGASAGAKLDSRVIYVLKQVQASLDRAEDLLKKQKLDQLESYAEGAEMKLAQLFKDFPVDQSHPEIVAVRSRIDRLKAGVGGLGAKAEAMGAQLPSMFAALQAADKRLQASLNVAYRHESAFRSVDIAGAIEMGVDGHAEPIDAMATTVESCNQILAMAQEAAAAFRTQFPDPEALRTLVKDSWKAVECVSRVEKFGSEWNRAREGMAKEKLREAKQSVATYVDRLEWAQKQEASVRRTTADGIEQHGIVEPAAQVRLVRALFAGEASLSELQKEILAAADKMEGRILGLRRGVAALRDQVVNEEKLRLAGARFPKSSHRGGEWTQVEANMREAFARFAADKQLHRVGVYSPWDERTEARFRNDRWVVGTYRYVGGHCLARLPDGSYRCYRLTFRRTKQGDGSFGRLEVFGVGHSFQVLAENIDK